MKIKYIAVLIATIVALTLFAFLYIMRQTTKLPFKTNPRYELTAYSQFQSEDSDSLFLIRSWLFATFDKNGYCKAVKKYDKMEFDHFKINGANINKLNEYFEHAPIEFDLRQILKPRIYDGPTIRLDYIFGNNIKTLYFSEGGDSVYNRVFDELDFWNKKKDHVTYSDTIIIKEMRVRMLKSIRNDTEIKFKKKTNLNWKILE
jgi:hypothetical protein